MSSIDNVMKQKLNNYTLAKGQRQQLQRKKTGNLSVRSLADVVHKDDFADSGSEYLETLLVAVPKNNIKEWTAKYERLTPMVVPRSSRWVLFCPVASSRQRAALTGKLLQQACSRR